jgi:peptidoglycan/LPS O-acetylase OafA/YrhL
MSMPVTAARPGFDVSVPGATAGRIDILDALRGLAALVVVFMHGREVLWIGMGPYLKSHPFEVSVSSMLAYASAPFVFGAIGVSALFVLSGYVIHRGQARMLAKGAVTFDGESFLKRRFVRIYPTLILALAVTLVCDLVSRSFADHPLHGDIGAGTMIANLLALQGIAAPTYGSNSALWSLAIEIQFYLVYPLALSIRQRVGMDWMLALVTAVSILGALVLHLQGITAFPQFYLAWWAGAYIADREAAGRPLPQHWPWFTAVAIALGCMSYTLKLCSLGIVLWAIGLAPLMAYVIDRRFAWLAASTLLKAAGQFSYTLYAIHLPILVLASAALYGGVRQPNILVAAMISVAVIAVAYAAYELAEGPSVRRLKSMRT